MRFEGKSVLITASSGGIGQAAALLFSQGGAKVMLAGTSEERCEAVCARLRKQGASTAFCCGDLADKEYCEELITRTVRTHGGLDVLVNNAGVIPRGTIRETIDEMWFSTLQVNLAAVFYLCRAAINYMQQHGGGAIVNTASMWGLYPGPGHRAYCTTKGVVVAMTKSMGATMPPTAFG